MRTFSYILLGIVIIFVVNIVISLTVPSYRENLILMREKIIGKKISTPVDENKTIPQQSTELTGSTVLVKTGAMVMENNTGATVIIPTQTGSVATWSVVTTHSGAQINQIIVPTINTPIEPNIPLSGLFLAKIMPDIDLKKTENKGMFNIYLFNKIPFTTYVDEKKKIKVYAFDETYDTMLANLKLTSSVYKINETDQFFWYTFFLNPTRKDSTIRFVTAMEGRAIGVEVPKSYYPTLKNILLKE